MLNSRQHRLKDWLHENFVSGKYFTIEEICNAGLGYELNTNPRIHDKCVALSNDVKQLNWRPMLKDTYRLLKTKKVLSNFAKQNKNSKILSQRKKERLKKRVNTKTTLNHLFKLMELVLLSI